MVGSVLVLSVDAKPPSQQRHYRPGNQRAEDRGQCRTAAYFEKAENNRRRGENERAGDTGAEIFEGPSPQRPAFPAKLRSPQKCAHTTALEAGRSSVALISHALFVFLRGG